MWQFFSIKLNPLNMCSLFYIQVSLIMSCNSQASLPGPEQVDPPPSTTLYPRMSPTALHDEHMTPLPIMGPVPAPIATVELLPPPTYVHHEVASIITIPDSPPSTIPTRPFVLTTGAEGSDTPAAPYTQPLPETSEMEFVQPSEAVVEGDVHTEAKTRVVDKVAQTELRAEVQASSSAVNVIPLDHHNPEATLNAPHAVKRYLTRWPQGEKEPYAVFGNTDLHDFRTMHNNQDDVRRRAELAKVLPPHINVSLLHP